MNCIIVFDVVVRIGDSGVELEGWNDYIVRGVLEFDYLDFEFRELDIIYWCLKFLCLKCYFGCESIWGFVGVDKFMFRGL